MKKLQQYPFLTAFFTVMILGLLIGVIKAALYPQDISLKRYFAWHLAQPFWTELLPDYTVEGRSSLGVVEPSYADGFLKDDLEEGNVSGDGDPAGDPAAENVPEEAGEAGLSAKTPSLEDGDSSDLSVSDASTADPCDESTKMRPDGADKDADPGMEETATDNKGTTPVGVTSFVSYDPVRTDSPYFTDRGQIALTTEYPYDTVEDDYFADAAFIGDSRTLGLHDYSGWKDSADFYCENGFSIYRWTKGEKVTWQNTGRDVDLTQALGRKKYGKIYIMAGMNDLGYGNTQLFGEWFSHFLDMVREKQPDAVIYLMANLHISRKEDGKKKEMNNINVNDKNATIATFADGQSIFYLDANPLFTDSEGYLKADITFDGFHLYAANYPVWTDFIKNHAVLRP